MVLASELMVKLAALLAAAGSRSAEYSTTKGGRMRNHRLTNTASSAKRQKPARCYDCHIIFYCSKLYKCKVIPMQARLLRPVFFSVGANVMDCNNPPAHLTG